MHKLNDAWHHLGCRAKNISGGRNATIRDCLVLQHGIESYSLRKLYETPSNYSYKQTYYIVHIDNVLTYYNCSRTRTIIRMRTPSLFFSFFAVCHNCVGFYIKQPKYWQPPATHTCPKVLWLAHETFLRKIFPNISYLNKTYI